MSDAVRSLIRLRSGEWDVVVEPLGIEFVYSHDGETRPLSVLMGGEEAGGDRLVRIGDDIIAVDHIDVCEVPASAIGPLPWLFQSRADQGWRGFARVGNDTLLLIDPWSLV